MTTRDWIKEQKEKIKKDLDRIARKSEGRSALELLAQYFQLETEEEILRKYDQQESVSPEDQYKLAAISKLSREINKLVKPKTK